MRPSVISWLNCLISLVLDDISFWNFLGTFLGCWYTCSKQFWLFCISVSLLFGSLSYRNYTDIRISPDLDKISFWNILETFFGFLNFSSKKFGISCISVRLLVDSILGYIQFWMRYLSEIFWRHPRVDCTLVPSNSKFFVWLSVY